jgi:hypothetical protein
LIPSEIPIDMFVFPTSNNKIKGITHFTYFL